MTKKLIIFLFATVLLAQENNLTLQDDVMNAENTIIKINPNPNVYAALGNVIYDNVANIERLQDIPRFSKHTQQIQDYVEDVKNTKETGYAIENGTNSVSTSEYLRQIRALSKQNDKFQKDVLVAYKSSMKYKDNAYFYQLINSGLLDTQKYRDEIMSYYTKYSNSIDATGIIQIYLDEDKATIKKLKSSKKARVTKKQVQNAKIKRLRKNDKNKEEELRQELNDELSKTKSEILKEQRENLAD